MQCFSGCYWFWQPEAPTVHQMSAVPTRCERKRQSTLPDLSFKLSLPGKASWVVSQRLRGQSDTRGLRRWNDGERPLSFTHVERLISRFFRFLSGALALPPALRGLPEDAAEGSERGEPLQVHRGGGHGGVQAIGQLLARRMQLLCKKGPSWPGLYVEQHRQDLPKAQNCAEQRALGAAR